MTPAEIDAYRRVQETCTAVDNAFFEAFGDVSGPEMERINAARAGVKLETGRLRSALIKACGELGELKEVLLGVTAKEMQVYDELCQLVRERDELRAQIESPPPTSNDATLRADALITKYRELAKRIGKPLPPGAEVLVDLRHRVAELETQLDDQRAVAVNCANFAADRTSAVVAELEAQRDELRAAIKKHQEHTRGHDSCWENDLELWRTVDPDATYPHDQVPPEGEFKARCEAYYRGLVKP